MFEPGALLSERYRLRDRLGVGGMAEVWQAEDIRLERDVAVKVLLQRDAGLARRLRRESRILAGLNHPALVAVFDAGEVDGHPFLVLELVRGETLAALLQRQGHLPPARVAELGAALADGLAHAHALGVVHRDLKPSNVLVDKSGRARLVDFGIARTEDSTNLTGTGLSIGTAAYLSPEQLDAPGRVGPESDVYSLGLVLAEALTGRRVFPGPAPAAALARLRIDPPLADVPPVWADLLGSMTRRDPSDRPSAAAVALAVPSSAIDGAPVAASEAATEPSTPTAALPIDLAASPVAPVGAPRPDRRRLWLVTAALVALLGVGGVAALAARGEDGGGAVDTTDPAVSTTVTALPSAVAPVTVAPTTAPTTVPTSVPTTIDTTTTDPGPRGHDKPPKPPKPHDDGPGHGPGQG